MSRFAYWYLEFLLNYHQETLYHLKRTILNLNSHLLALSQNFTSVFSPNSIQRSPEQPMWHYTFHISYFGNDFKLKWEWLIIVHIHYPLPLLHKFSDSFICSFSLSLISSTKTLTIQPSIYISSYHLFFSFNLQTLHSIAYDKEWDSMSLWELQSEPRAGARKPFNSRNKSEWVMKERKANKNRRIIC